MSLGRPVIFLRLHECNLKCTWCDAWYTWDKEREEYWSEATEYDVPTLAVMMVEWMDKVKCSRWVISGGEPMMQKWALDKLLSLIFDAGATAVEFETNGTIPPTDYMALKSKEGLIQFNVSPKLKNSGNAMHQMFKPDVIQDFAQLNSYFKFVVSREEDVEEILGYAAFVPQDRIVLMPEGVTQEDLQKHQVICDQLCKEYGWRLTPRLHIQLYGDVRAT